MINLADQLHSILKNIPLLKPVVHHITNSVSINDCANITAALGASPVMAYNEKEVKEITTLSNALVLNLGTPDTSRFEAAAISGRVANQLDLPVIIDPIGVGASQLRSNGVKMLCREVMPTVIKGNAAEIKTLAGLGIRKNKVIDAAETIDSDNLHTIKAFALNMNSVVAITGKVDIVTDGTHLVKMHRGTEMFTYISGAGCMTSSVIGTFSSVEKDPFVATVCAIYAMNICGEKAAKMCDGPADFKSKLINEFFVLSQEEIKEEGVFFE